MFLAQKPRLTRGKYLDTAMHFLIAIATGLYYDDPSKGKRIELRPFTGRVPECVQKRKALNPIERLPTASLSGRKKPCG